MNKTRKADEDLPKTSEYWFFTYFWYFAFFSSLVFISLRLFSIQIFSTVVLNMF